MSNNNQDLPIPVTFDYSGNAQYGMDYNRANGFTIIPPNSSSIIDTIEIIQDTENESTELLDLSLIDNSCVQLSKDSLLQFSINDMLTSIPPEHELNNNPIKLFPNPSQERVYIEFNSSDFDIKIFSSKGQLFKSFKNQSFNSWIDINQFSAGIYFLEIQNNISNVTTIQKLIKH